MSIRVCLLPIIRICLYEVAIVVMLVVVVVVVAAGSSTTFSDAV